MQKEINVRELKDNFVKMISDDWALLTAGTTDDFNTMTVSWGGIGELWGKDVCFVFVAVFVAYKHSAVRFGSDKFNRSFKIAVSVCSRVFERIIR